MASLKTASAVVAATALVAAGAYAARGGAVWTVVGKLYGKRRRDRAGFETSRDVSGIACATATGFPRIGLVVDDESQGVQIVRVEDGRLVAGDFIRLIYDRHDGEPLELDAEGVAYADGFFYVVGSHGRPRHMRDRARDKARGRASRHLFRLRFDPDMVDADGVLTGAVDIRDSSVLSGILRDRADFDLGFDGSLGSDGLTVEGVAVRGAHLYVGLRAPLVSRGKAAVLSVPLDRLFGTGKGKAQLHRLDLGEDRSGKPRGVRDLVAHGSDFLVIAGPVQDPASDVVRNGDYAVYDWDGAGPAERRCDLRSHGRKVKPEGLLPLAETDGALSVLMVFDGPKEGGPRTVALA